MRVSLCDMVASVQREVYERIDITDGPGVVLDRIATVFREFLALEGRAADEVLGIGIDVPGPVDHGTGRVVSPPIMTGWHDFDIPGFFAEEYACPVIVEKDANAMAFGEHRLVHATTEDIIFVKFGTGIGTGLIINGEIYRGSDGAAGDVGHIPLTVEGAVDDAPVCRCGNSGCIEAYAGGWAIMRDLRALGRPIESIDDLVREALEGRKDATRLVRAAAGIIGTAVSDLVSILNPRTIVIGGQLAAIDGLLFAGIREVVYRRSLPLATRDVHIVPSALDERGWRSRVGALGHGRGLLPRSGESPRRALNNGRLATTFGLRLPRARSGWARQTGLGRAARRTSGETARQCSLFTLSTKEGGCEPIVVATAWPTSPRSPV